jgi:death-on-curing protein
VTEHLDLEDLLAAAEAALGRQPEVRDIGLLEAAVARTRATAFGAEAYPDLDSKAAALLHSLVTGHPLVDGNKRLGWVAVRLWYRLNDQDLVADPDAAFELVVAVAGGSVRDVEAIATRLAAWRTRLPESSTTGMPERSGQAAGYGGSDGNTRNVRRVP